MPESITIFFNTIRELHGVFGLLLFKLICNETLTTKELNQRAMITIIKTHRIKTSCKGEVIFNVVDLFLSISDTMAAIYDDKLPEDYAQ